MKTTLIFSLLLGAAVPAGAHTRPVDATAPAVSETASLRLPGAAATHVEPADVQLAALYYTHTTRRFVLAADYLYTEGYEHFRFSHTLLSDRDREVRVLALNLEADGRIRIDLRTETGISGSLYATTLDELQALLTTPQLLVG